MFRSKVSRTFVVAAVLIAISVVLASSHRVLAFTSGGGINGAKCKMTNCGTCNVIRTKGGAFNLYWTCHALKCATDNQEFQSCEYDAAEGPCQPRGEEVTCATCQYWTCPTSEIGHCVSCPCTGNPTGTWANKGLTNCL